MLNCLKGHSVGWCADIGAHLLGGAFRHGEIRPLGFEFLQAAEEFVVFRIRDNRLAV